MDCSAMRENGGEREIHGGRERKSGENNQTSRGVSLKGVQPF